MSELLPSASASDAGAAQTASAERSRIHALPSPSPPPPLPPPLPRRRRPPLHELLSGVALVGAASHSHLYRRALARLQLLRCADVSEDDALRTGMWLAAKSMLAAGHTERAQDAFMCCKVRSAN
jgi:hypothetical protein